MRFWKVMLGLGTACAACCAIPLLAAAGGLAALGSATWARADEFIPAAVLGAIAAGLASVWWWRKRKATRAGPCGCAASCSTGVERAKA